MQDIHPINAPISPNWWGLFLTMMVLIGVMVLVWWWKQRRSRKVAVDLPPEVPLEDQQSVKEKALSKLEQLDELIAATQYTMWYEHASLVLREYASQSGNSNLLMLATAEIVIAGADDRLVELLQNLDGGIFAERGLDETSVLRLRREIEAYIRT
jgi:hypothetical protein